MNTPLYYFEKTAPRGSALYYSLLSTKPEKRKVIIALHALYNELMNSVDNVKEPSVVQMKLAWWQQEINHMYEMKATHPITEFLQTAVTQYKLPKPMLDELIQGAGSKLMADNIMTEKDFNLVCYRCSGIISLLSAYILGHVSEETIAFAHDLGLSFEITHMIAHFRDSVINNKVYFCLDDIKKYHIDPNKLTNYKMTNNVRHMLKFEANRARKYYLNALNILPANERKAQRHLLILGKLTMTLLDEIEAMNYELFDYEVKLTPLRKIWIALRTR